MLPKTLLLVLLVLPLAYAQMGGSSEEGMEEYGGYGEAEAEAEAEPEAEPEMEEHYPGDGDCKSKEEAKKKMMMFFMMMKKMKEMHKKKEMMDKKKEMAEKMKKFMMFKKFMMMKKEKEMMEKKKKMAEMMEKMKKFHDFMKAMHEKKEDEAAEQKEKMKEMWEKFKAMKEKKEKEEEFKDMIEGFKETKHKMAFQLTHHFLKMCKCGEIDAQMTKMFMGMKTKEDGDLTEEMAEGDAMSAWESGDMSALAAKLKKLTKEQKKKLFMAGLIKSMCAGAKTFVVHAKQFEEKFMSGNMTSSD